MKELKGTKTEKNLMEAFAVNHRLVTSTLTLPQRQKKMAMCKLQLSLKKLPTTKRNTLKCGSNSLKAVL